MMCDSSQAGSVMECPTCFQKITAPQAPASDEQKFILTGSKVAERKITVPSMVAVLAKPERDHKLLKAAAFILILALVAGGGIYLFGGKFLPLVSTSAWQASDIGEAGAAGSFSQANGVFTINGSGADTWLRADGFHYVFQALTGDGALAARVLNIQNTDMWAKAGVMIRDTTNATSMFALAAIRSDGQVQFVWRNATGGEAGSSELVGGMGTPKWVKVGRSGNAFTAYYKVNAGDEWRQIGAVQMIGMTPKAQIGLVVCAHHAGILCQAQFDQVTLQVGNQPGQQ